MACDSDGVLFMPEEKFEEIVATATEIRETERRQAAKMQAGVSFRQQVRFADYLTAGSANHAFGFRKRLKTVGAATEE